MWSCTFFLGGGRLLQEQYALLIEDSPLQAPHHLLCDRDCLRLKAPPVLVSPLLARVCLLGAGGTEHKPLCPCACKASSLPPSRYNFVSKKPGSSPESYWGWVKEGLVERKMHQVRLMMMKVPMTDERIQTSWVFLVTGEKNILLQLYSQVPPN